MKQLMEASFGQECMVDAIGNKSEKGTVVGRCLCV